MKITKTTPDKIEVEYPELVIDYEILTSDEFEHRCTDFKNVMENQRRKCNLNTSDTMYKDRLDEIKVAYGTLSLSLSLSLHIYPSSCLALSFSFHS